MRRGPRGHQGSAARAHAVSPLPGTHSRLSSQLPRSKLYMMDERTMTMTDMARKVMNNGTAEEAMVWKNTCSVVEGVCVGGGGACG
jgi:hypothetical protein